MIAQAESGIPTTTSRDRWQPLLISVAAISLITAVIRYRVSWNGTGDGESVLQSLVIGIYRTFGFQPTLMFCTVALAWSSIWYFRERIERPGLRMLHVALFALSLAIFLNLGEDRGARPHTGAVGAWFADGLSNAFGVTFSVVLLVVVTLCTFLLATDFLFARYFVGAPAGGGAVEAGVEPEVTEHLKGLAATLAAPPITVEPSVPAARPREDLADEFATGQSGAPAIAPEEPYELPRRVRYRDRYAPSQPVDPVEPAEPAALAGDEPGEGLFAAAESSLAEELAAPADAAASSWPTDEPAAAVGGEPETADEEDIAAHSEPPVDDAAGALAEVDWLADPDRADAQAGVATPAEGAEDGSPPVQFEESEPADQLAEAVAPMADEPVEIPRPEEGVRQQSLFVRTVDEGLVHEALAVIEGSGRASASLLQRKLRIGYDDATELLELLERRGLLGTGSPSEPG